MLDSVSAVQVTGDSMRPLLLDGDTVLVCTKKELSYGDLVLCQSSNEKFVHRFLVSAIKGDRVKRFDSNPTKILGKVIAWQGQDKIRKFNSIESKILALLSSLNHEKRPIMRVVGSLLGQIFARYVRWRMSL